MIVIPAQENKSVFLHIYRPQRSCGQGYVFTRVCHFVNRGGGVCSGECLLRGVSALGVSTPGGGVSALGGVCSWGGCLLHGGLLGGVCSAQGASALLRGHLLCSGGVCSGGVSAPGGVCSGGCLLPGVSAPGGVSAPRGRRSIPACTEADTPPPCLGSRAQHTVNEWLVRILLECILVAIAMDQVNRRYEIYWVNLSSQWRIQGGAPLLRTKIFLILCSFWESPANLYVGAPPRSLRPLLRGILYPPLLHDVM